MRITKDDWEKVLVFPDVIAAKDDGTNHDEVAEKTLGKLSVKNLAYIAKKLGVSTSDDTSAATLTTSLLMSSHSRDLVNLVNFAKGRGRLAAADELFESRLETTKKRKVSGDFDGLKGRGTLQSFTKLFALLSEGVEWLERVFLHSLWRSKATHSAFQADGILNADTCKQLADGAVSIASELTDSNNYDCKLFLNSEVEPDVVLFLFQRERKPQVRADYRHTKLITYGFGWVLFGIDTKRNRLIFKSGGEDAIGIVKGKLQEIASVKLTPEGVEPFTNYDYEAVSAKLLGDYDSNSGVQLVGLTLARCNRRSVSLMAIGPPLFGSIREDLKFLKEHDAIALSSLADLRELKVRYENRDIPIKATIDNYGLVFLKIDDSGFPPSRVGELLDAFETTFGLPLNCRINPMSNAMGYAPVIASVLRVSSPGEVAQFQQQVFAWLRKQDLLDVATVNEMRCDNRGCKVGVVESPQSSACPECHDELVQHQRSTVAHNEDEIFKALQKFFKTNTTRTLEKGLSTKSRRGSVYSLKPKDSDDVPFEVLVATESDSHLVRRCAMIHRPVLVIHTHAWHSVPYTDPLGTVHLDLADILAASQNAEDLSKLAEQLEELLSAGKTRLHEISLRAGAVAVESLKNKGEGYTDQDYERDVFAILRSMFPFTDRWGGANKPDGFVSLSYFEGGNVRENKKINWSYDAKLTAKIRGKGEERGYDLSKGEKRKAYEYVAALQNEPALQSQGNQLDAHVFISPWITEDKAKGMAEHFRLEHNERGLSTPTHIAVMMEDFLVQFHAAFHQNRIAILKRWPFVGKVLKKWLLKDKASGYCVLDGPDAATVIAEILELPEAETPIDAKKLRESQGG